MTKPPAETPQEALETALAAVFGGAPPPDLGISISGGGDSVALAVLLADWARLRGVTLWAATVDHGLRAASVAEAEAAGRLCASLGIAHTTLHWRGWDQHGNLQDAARRARQNLLADWAKAHGIAAIALGHTRDDQAETVLMRLARGSGVDGLAAMAVQRQAHGILWVRPLLEVGRASLRDLLRVRAIPWADDPSNEDPRYDRVKARQALAMLAPLGITTEGLVETAARMALARQALANATVALMEQTLRIDPAGEAVIDPAVLDAPADLRERLFAQTLMWLSGADYRPRHAALRKLIADLTAGRGGTLMGCAASLRGDGAICIGREPKAVAALRSAMGQPWDGRWHLTAPPKTKLDGLEVACLGHAGLALCPDWRETGLGRRAVLTSPAVWCGDTLIAAPLARSEPGWHAELRRNRDDLRTRLLLH